MSSDSENLILRCEVWDGGKGDDQYRVLRNRMVTARKAHRCAVCWGGIEIGARIRSQTEISDGQIQTFRFCPKCCSAMLTQVVVGEPDEFLERFEIGRARAESDRV